MDTLDDRIYFLLTIDRHDLILNFKYPLIFNCVYVVMTILFTFVGISDKRYIIIGVVTLTLLIFIMLVLDLNRLDIFESTTKSLNQKEELVIDNSKSFLLVESSADDLQFFSFNDRVKDTFTIQDSEAMVDLLYNRHELRLKEVIK